MSLNEHASTKSSHRPDSSGLGDMRRCLRDIHIEIALGKILSPQTPLEEAYNYACDRAIRIIETHIDGTSDTVRFLAALGQHSAARVGSVPSSTDSQARSKKEREKHDTSPTDNP